MIGKDQLGKSRHRALTTDSDGHLFSYDGKGAIYIRTPQGDAMTSFMTLKPTSGLVGHEGRCL
jgi:hypothetical protein